MSKELVNLMRISVLICLTVLVTTFWRTEVLGAETEDLRPEIRLNDPFAGNLWQLDVNSDMGLIAVSSHYKTATIWSLRDFSKPQMTFYAPRRNEEPKRQHGVAISPDGSWVAYGVPPLIQRDGRPVVGTAKIYVFDLKSGEIVHQIEGLESRTQRLKFSPNGKYLAAALSDGCGVRVWRTGGKWLPFDKDDVGYASFNSGCGGSGRTAGLLFYHDRQSELHLITSGDSGVRLYRFRSGRLQKLTHATPSDVQLPRPADIAISPDGAKLAVGSLRGLNGEFGLRVAVIGLPSLKPVQKQPLELVVEEDIKPSARSRARNEGALNFGQVAWVVDARGQEALYAAGTLWCIWLNDTHLVKNASELDRRNCMARWDILNGKIASKPVFYAAGTNTIYGLKDVEIGDNRSSIIYISAKRIEILDEQGNTKIHNNNNLILKRSSYDFRMYDYREFKLSKDGSKIFFENYLGDGSEPIRVGFDVSALSFFDQIEDLSEYVEFNEDPEFFGHKDMWRSAASPPTIIFAGRKGKIADHDWHPAEITYSVSVFGNKSTYIIGSSDNLRFVTANATGHEVSCSKPIVSPAFRLVYTEDQNFLVVGHSDGVLRWYEKKADTENCNLNLFLSVYLHRSSAGAGEWFAWTPNGVFAHSPGALETAGWLIPRGAKQLWSSFSEFDYKTFNFLTDNKFSGLEKMNNPDLIRSILFDENARRRIQKTSITMPDLVLEGSREAEPLRIEFSDELRAGEEVLEATQVIKISLAPMEDNVFVSWPRYLSIVVNGKYTYFSTDKQNAGPKNPAIVDNSDREMRLLVEIPGSARTDSGAPLSICVRVSDSADRLSQFQQECLELEWAGNTEKVRRRLWAVFMGISDYEEPRKLEFAEFDALDFSSLLLSDFISAGARSWRTYDELSLHLAISSDSPAAVNQLEKLTSISQNNKVTFSSDRSPTPDNILSKISEIVEESLEKPKNDFEYENVLLLFFSGHGITLKGEEKDSSRLIFNGANWNKAESLLKHSVGAREIQYIANRFSGKKLFVFDACRSEFGDAGFRQFKTDEVSPIYERLSKAFIIFAAASGKKSFQHANWDVPGRLSAAATTPTGNSLLTYALFHGLTNRDADKVVSGNQFHKSGQIEFGELREFVIDNVLNRSIVVDTWQEKQVPQFVATYDNDNADFFPLRRIGAND